MIDLENKEYILKNAIHKVKDEYDFIIIDCPPSLSMLTINAMTTASSVLVPIQCEYYALEGLSQLIHTVELVKNRLNSELEIEGVVFTMYDARTNLSLQVVENVKDNLEQNIYKTISDLQKHQALVCQLIYTIQNLLVQKAIENWLMK